MKILKFFGALMNTACHNMLTWLRGDALFMFDHRRPPHLKCEHDCPLNKDVVMQGEQCQECGYRKVRKD